MITRLRWVMGALAACALILATVGLAHISVEAIAPTETPDFEEVCDAVLTRALAFTEQRCGATGRNEACYGYTDVTAAFQPNVDDVKFSWNVRNSDPRQAGTDTAVAEGTTLLTTLTEQGSNTVEIWVDGELNDSQSGNAEQCP